MENQEIEKNKRDANIFSGKIEANLNGVIEITRDSKKDEEINIMIYERFFKSLRLIFLFYTILGFISVLLFLLLSRQFLISWSIILAGNFFIAVITQLLHFLLRNEEHIFRNYNDCIIRCSAGILEMVFYTIAFAINVMIVLAGYLILKTLSIWKPGKSVEDAVRKEGLSTAVLRIAVVLSLLFSLVASYFFFHALEFFEFFPGLSNHFLYGK